MHVEFLRPKTQMPRCNWTGRWDNIFLFFILTIYNLRPGFIKTMSYGTFISCVILATVFVRFFFFPFFQQFQTGQSTDYKHESIIRFSLAFLLTELHQKLHYVPNNLEKNCIHFEMKQNVIDFKVINSKKSYCQYYSNKKTIVNFNLV